MSKSDRAIRWIATHQEEVKKYAGKLIAVHPSEGIIDSDRDFAELSKRLRVANRLGEVVIDSVPATPKSHERNHQGDASTLVDRLWLSFESRPIFCGV